MRTIIFPNQQIVTLPRETAEAITKSQSKYQQPLWQFRAEGVLKLGGHQWIYPSNPLQSAEIHALYPHGLLCTAWKLFNRSWSASAEAYFVDTSKYPNHPRHFGQGVVPLVDEDQDGQQIGWVRILQQTQTTEDYAVFVQFLLLDLFPPTPLPAEYV